jgi:hypothetical protein
VPSKCEFNPHYDGGEGGGGRSRRQREGEEGKKRKEGKIESVTKCLPSKTSLDPDELTAEFYSVLTKNNNKKLNPVIC